MSTRPMDPTWFAAAVRANAYELLPLVLLLCCFDRSFPTPGSPLWAVLRRDDDDSVCVDFTRLRTRARWSDADALVVALIKDLWIGSPNTKTPMARLLGLSDYGRRDLILTALAVRAAEGHGPTTKRWLDQLFPRA